MEHFESGEWIGMLSLLLYGFFCFLFCLGLVFLVIWAARVMDKKALTKWTIILLTAGIVGGIISTSLIFWKTPEIMDKFKWKEGKGCTAVTTETKAPAASAPVAK